MLDAKLNLCIAFTYPKVQESFWKKGRKDAVDDHKETVLVLQSLSPSAFCPNVSILINFHILQDFQLRV